MCEQIKVEVRLSFPTIEASRSSSIYGNTHLVQPAV